MKWLYKGALSRTDLVNFCQGRVIEKVYSNIIVGADEDELMYPVVFTFVGLEQAGIGLDTMGSPHILAYVR